MKVRISGGWYSHLSPLFNDPRFSSLVDFVRTEYSSHRCFPKGKDIFRAFDITPFDQLKVIILGQDPYHNFGQAHGLCFSVPDRVAHPPSLVNIFSELKSDLGIPHPVSGDLSRWARQGILLLNTTLTVRAHQPRSHQGKGWEWFSDSVIELLSKKKKGLVFILWGAYAKAKRVLIDDESHLILLSGHPSPLSANRGYWFGNRHFSLTNQYLKSHGLEPILW
ncbi:MAG: uracil-DNA glycosylase [Flavobacteriaceae bacterium]|nr:uracil-DNA glycosylase [Flavobacteriaceae bacterium]